jgi:hypothetical protein
LSRRNGTMAARAAGWGTSAPSRHERSALLLPLSPSQGKYTYLDCMDGRVCTDRRESRRERRRRGEGRESQGMCTFPDWGSAGGGGLTQTPRCRCRRLSLSRPDEARDGRGEKKSARLSPESGVSCLLGALVPQPAARAAMVYLYTLSHPYSQGMCTFPDWGSAGGGGLTQTPRCSQLVSHQSRVSRVCWGRSSPSLPRVLPWSHSF